MYESLDNEGPSNRMVSSYGSSGIATKTDAWMRQELNVSARFFTPPLRSLPVAKRMRMSKSDRESAKNAAKKALAASMKF